MKQLLMRSSRSRSRRRAPRWVTFPVSRWRGQGRQSLALRWHRAASGAQTAPPAPWPGDAGRHASLRAPRLRPFICKLETGALQGPRGNDGGCYKEGVTTLPATQPWFNIYLEFILFLLVLGSEVQGAPMSASIPKNVHH